MVYPGSNFSSFGWRFAHVWTEERSCGWSLTVFSWRKRSNHTLDGLFVRWSRILDRCNCMACIIDRCDRGCGSSVFAQEQSRRSALAGITPSAKKGRATNKKTACEHDTTQVSSIYVIWREHCVCVVFVWFSSDWTLDSVLAMCEFVYVLFAICECWNSLFLSRAPALSLSLFSERPNNRLGLTHACADRPTWKWNHSIQ